MANEEALEARFVSQKLALGCVIREITFRKAGQSNEEPDLKRMKLRFKKTIF